MDREDHQGNDDGSQIGRRLNNYIEVHGGQQRNKILIAPGYHRTDARIMNRPYFLRCESSA